MRECGIRGKGAAFTRRKAGVYRFFERTHNARLGQAAPTAVNQVWAGDVTYLRLGEQWRYLATIMDLFSRGILAWTISRHPHEAVTLRVLKRALAERRPQPGLIFHSDRGIEYSAYDYQAFLSANGFVPSMNRPQTCQDNAHMESFFRSLKPEFAHNRTFSTDMALGVMVDTFVGKPSARSHQPPRSKGSLWQLLR
jgi:putative transposase